MRLELFDENGNLIPAPEEPRMVLFSCGSCQNKDCETRGNGNLMAVNCERAMYGKTNHDKIVQKTPGEFADWIADILNHCSNGCCDDSCPMYECCMNQSSDNIEDWLMEDAKYV